MIRYVLDVGSSSLRLFAITKYCGEMRIITEEDVLYDGYIDGEFLSQEKLTDDLTVLIEKMSCKMHKSINSITVGVPADFCICVCKRIKRVFVEQHKVTQQDVFDLFESNKSFGDSENYIVINCSPMQFELDDETKTISAVNKKTSMLSVDASYILAKKSFIDLITEKLNEVGVKNVEFISTSLGQGTTCEKQGDNSKPIAIVDCGHITTSVCVYVGEGLALLTSFSMGGGHISSDIMQVLDTSYQNAELIKRKVILTVDSEKNEDYEVCFKGNLIKAPINITNQVVKSRIEMIAKAIDSILSIDEVFKDIDIYLTGDGISNFKGAKAILRDITKRNVYEYKIPFDNTKNKFQTSRLGLMTLIDEAK